MTEAPPLAGSNGILLTDFKIPDSKLRIRIQEQNKNMALVGKRDDLIHVPWSSVEEWIQVYKQIYSGDLVEQNKAYETLLVWKARIPKLPVGIECTLGLIQVCLRDREWTPKINNGEISTSYENDLRMLYSTMIMKFLNHISNIAYNKKTSLFIIAKQLNIPDWIVDLRHDIAHGHELPSIDVMRVVANMLLTWIHEEYWVVEAKNLQESQDLIEQECLDSRDEENLADLIELWTAVKLYLKTKHDKISDLPDTEIKDTLNNLLGQNNVNNTSNGKSLTITDETELTVILNLILSEISKNISKSDSFVRKEKVVIDSIINNEAFLTNIEILSIFIENKSGENIKNCLPQSLIDFWKDLLLLLQEKKILLSLFLQLIELMNKEKDTNKKLFISLWIKCIAQAYNKQKIARHMFQILEQKFDHENPKLTVKEILKAVENEIEKQYPDMKNVLYLNVNTDFPKCLTDEKFVKRLVLNYNEFSEHYIPEILKISSFLECDSDAKEKLLTLMKIHSLTDKNEEIEVENTNKIGKVYTIQDLQNIKNIEKNSAKKIEYNQDLADCKIRNKKWKIASGNYNWSTCSIGVLPWQMNDIQPIEPLSVSPSEIRYAIVKNLELPKIVDSNKLKLHSKIQWENLLKKKKKGKRKDKTSGAASTLVDQTMESVGNGTE